MASEVGVGYVRLIPSMDGFAAAVRSDMPDLESETGTAGRNAGQGFVSGFGTAIASGGRAMSSAGDQLTMGVTLPVLGLGAAALATSRQFNEGMANIGTLIPGNTARVAELKTGIQDLSVQVGSGTSDMAEGMYNVISAFGDGAESIDLLAINARAAKAGMATTTDAINLTSAVTKGYGDTSAEAVQKASDLALLTVRMGQTTFPELASSMGKVIPIGQSLGVTQEELFGSMATFTGVTGTASEVSTQLRGAMQSLLAPTTDAQTALEDAGFASGAAAVEQLGLAGAVQLLTDAADASGQPLQKFIGSVEGQTIALGLAGAQSDDYQTKLAAMADAQGVTDEAFRAATEGVNASGFAFDQAKAKAQVTAQQLGDGLAPALIAVLDAAQPAIAAITDLSTRFAEADPQTQKMIAGAIGIVAALGPVLSITGRLVTGLGGAVRGMAAFGRGSVTAAKAGGRLAVGLGRGAAAFARMSVAAARAALSVARAGIQMAVAAAKAAARVVASVAVQIARWVALGIQSLLAAAKVALAWLISLGPIAIVIAAVVGLVALIIKNWDTIKSVISRGWAFVKASTTRVWNAIKSFLSAAVNAIKTAVMTRVNAIRTAVTTAWNRAKTLTTTAWNGIKRVITSAIRSARIFVASAINAIVGFFAGIPGRVAKALGSLASKVAKPFKDAYNAAKKWLNKIPGVGAVAKIGGAVAKKLPFFHDGGVYRAPPGRTEGPAMLEDGEAVFTPEQLDALGQRNQTVVAPMGMVLTLNAAGASREVKELIRHWVRVEGGGNVQLAMGA